MPSAQSIAHATFAVNSTFPFVQVCLVSGLNLIGASHFFCLLQAAPETSFNSACGLTNLLLPKLTYLEARNGSRYYNLDILYHGSTIRCDS